MGDFGTNILEAVEKLREIRNYLPPDELPKLRAGMAELRKLSYIPRYYLDSIELELKDMLTGRGYSFRRDAAAVYLAFFGVGGVAEYLKIGIAKNVKFRMDGHATSNPFEQMWVYSAMFGSRLQAGAVERALISSQAEHNIKGEWIRVNIASTGEATRLAESLAEVASRVAERPVVFTRDSLE